MSEDGTKRLLIVVQLKSDSTKERVYSDAPGILKMITRLSTGEEEIAFRSSDGRIFGVFIVTKVPHFIDAEFTKCTGTQNGDSLLVFEAGALVTAQGFGRAFTWLQRH